ncbi:pyrimidine-nucleoside phosphorylase [Paenibacillus turpanensis]|uniref:pyrimidine-nucleoside phosphorylase n=1 Tax=Paenibacillus turpanensis TaxID=2689078 RepID=UPI00140C71A4|nr:pyrimidine-nucleoside phosphorylase [Paenibacillus turpanensis]
MRTVDIIQKKRDGGELSAAEIRFLIDGYVKGDIPDYQVSAWAMAVFFQGMSPRETAELTMAMAESGDMIDLSPIHGVKVDKHSTGGVGDSVTLALAPMVAAAGVPVAKMSGRGLGHTGGTIDKLESIPGFRVELSRDDFIRQVNEIGLAVIGQSGNITPADKKLYGLRDVTATVNSIPLIASSIMSKKLASGADAIVLDVKTGNGAFMKSLDDSIRLAQAMVDIGTELGRHTVAVISDMDQPLGSAIGNALEVKEAIHVLKGEGTPSLTDICLALGSHMLVLGGKAESPAEGERLLRESIANGTALAKFEQFIKAQGGAAAVAQDPQGTLPAAARIVPVEAGAAGYVTRIVAEEIGTAAMLLGAGRATKESQIDLAVGIILRKRVGERVEAGEAIAELHVNGTQPDELERVAQMVRSAYDIHSQPTEAPPLLYAVVTKDGVQRLEAKA